MTNPITDPAADSQLDQLRHMIEHFARQPLGLVRANPGDTLVVLMNHDPGEPFVEHVTAVLPDLAVVVLHGTAGALVVTPDEHMPPPADTTPDYHDLGVYCGEPAHCTEPHPGALPGTAYTPAYAHRLLDALLTGRALDFDGAPIPTDIRLRLEDAATEGRSPTCQTRNRITRGLVCESCGTDYDEPTDQA